MRWIEFTLQKFLLVYVSSASPCQTYPQGPKYKFPPTKKLIPRPQQSTLLFDNKIVFLSTSYFAIWFGAVDSARMTKEQEEEDLEIKDGWRSTGCFTFNPFSTRDGQSASPHSENRKRENYIFNPTFFTTLTKDTHT